jgi:2-amino-4-hydroxy-6-hydroxymethyldihydropteridine diphosphokinase
MGAATIWVPAYIGLGSNLDDPVRQLGAALQAIGGIRATRLVARSGLFRNPPLGLADQPHFVNAVAGVVTRLEPRELLGALLGIETAHGRRRDHAVRWGPREIDLDLLVYGQVRLDEVGLTLPHPGIAERNFVLFPLHEIAPELVIPGHGRVGELLESLDCSALERLG